ncbi:MAG: hypothetical protein JO061_24655 [Acidobacteriaceae bacterium]|nr:hypothetical protein [Acidobacteriaceae bacterium]
MSLKSLEADGILYLRVPTGLPETDVEVVVVVQPVQASANGWPEDFFQETYGAFADQPLERGNQGEFEAREVVKAELVYGAAKSNVGERTTARLNRFCGMFNSLPFDDRFGHHVWRDPRRFGATRNTNWTK